jgi:hypothetical protein
VYFENIVLDSKYNGFLAFGTYSLDNVEFNRLDMAGVPPECNQNAVESLLEIDDSSAQFSGFGMLCIGGNISMNDVTFSDWVLAARISPLVGPTLGENYSFSDITIENSLGGLLVGFFPGEDDEKIEMNNMNLNNIYIRNVTVGIIGFYVNNLSATDITTENATPYNLGNVDLGGVDLCSINFLLE